MFESKDDTQVPVVAVFVALFVLTCVVLPKGYVYGVPVKMSLALVSTLLVAVQGIYNKRIGATVLAWMCGLALFLLTYSLRAVMLDVPSFSLESQARAFAATIAGVGIPLSAISVSAWSTGRAVRWILYSCKVYAISRIIVVALIATGIVSVSELSTVALVVFNYEMMPMRVGLLVRLFLPSDFLLPGFIYMVLVRYHLGIRMRSWIAFFWIIVALGGIVSAYSRYLWLLGVLALLGGHLVATKGSVFRRTLRGSMQMAVVALLIVVSLVLAVRGSATIRDALQDRFYGAQAGASDTVREEMWTSLTEEFTKHPIWGGGLGANSPTLVRFPDMPWNYELQWLAFSMQFGLIGILALTGIVLAMLRIALGDRGSVSVFAAGLLLLWVAAGLFNSFLITSASGIVYLEYILIGKTRFELVQSRGYRIGAEESCSR